MLVCLQLDIQMLMKKKIVNGRVFRFLDELSEFVPRSKEHPNGINVLYTQRFDQNGIYHEETHAPSPKILKLVKDELDYDLQWPEGTSTRKAVDPKTYVPMVDEIRGKQK